LRRAVETLTQVAQGRSTPGPSRSSAREAGASSGDSQDRLAAAIEKLTQVIQSERGTGTSRAPVNESWKGQGFPTLEAIWQGLDAATANHGNPELIAFDGQLRRSHIAWMYQDVVERYGTPSFVGEAPGGITVDYMRDVTSNGPKTLCFKVSQGFVTDVCMNP
jgi:hypothetical protein